MKRLLSLMIVLAIYSQAQAEKIFDRTEPLNVKLSAPFGKLLAGKTTNFVDVKSRLEKGQLTLTDTEGKSQTFQVEVKIKGFSSVNFCSFPKLELKITSPTKDTLFQGNKKIDLNTHCLDADLVKAADSNSQYAPSFERNHREVVAYRILKSLGMLAYETRPILINYEDQTTPSEVQIQPNKTYQAFLIEDKSQFIDRTKYVEVRAFNESMKAWNISKKPETASSYRFKGVNAAQKQFTLSELAEIDLFEYLIFNSDWFLKADARHSRFPGELYELWNIKIFELKPDHWMPMAQDFNYSGLALAEIYKDLREQPTSRWIAKMSTDEKENLKNKFSNKKDEILGHVELLKDDPLYNGIKAFLQFRLGEIDRALQ